MKSDNRKVATFDEKCRALQEVYTSEFYAILFKHAIIRLKTVFGIKYNHQKGFRGIMIEDMINDTIEAFLREGGRNWYLDKFPDFRKQIISALDSVISNTLNAELDKANETFEIMDNDVEMSFDDSDYQSLLSICHDELTAMGATDDELLLFEPYIINGMKRNDLSELLGIGIDELTNIKKRLDRKLPFIKEKLKVLNYEK
ncbi:hypothetical protein DMB65_04605 [Flavobacterium cheongpyeongense]|jgi:hypothetical protein|uniref:Uncharacterized protein n=1 Tax=Flavobacterium cheongpyeongense TaxID=2212651 RepID=A0A2V4BVS3_9FLAO|nr:hypothetical protein [Flavobacterium cheongpyeongense]PXY41850.1 hypothetical protein DMB65_04605 [Flavobacterium cheongpyeongense]